MGIMDNGVFLGTRGILDKSRWKVQGHWGREKKILFWGDYWLFIEVMGKIINVK